jgi:hypothetical protein
VKFPSRNSTFVPDDDQFLPDGTIVNVSNGKGVKLTDRDGDSTVFYGGKDGVPSIFKIKKFGNVIELQLIGGNFKKCTSRALQASDAKKKPIRRLWGKGKGHFRTKARFASATIRGTWWLTADFCDYTSIFVRQGVVTVRDLVKGKTIRLPAGKTYKAYKKKR